MTDTRRDFIKKATLLAGASGLFTVLPESIQKALAIDADKGTTFMDAEHVVFLMQENRSFDHCYGTLQGVRGFDDPRAMHLPGQNKVWAQSNQAGKTYVPFNLDIKNSKATWMQSLPHSWDNQVDARNGGKMDNWLESKKSGNKQYADMPLTMGYYDRNDIPFYYAFADAFTVCDQHFCSSLTGTSSNRSYFWAATIREQQNAKSKALVYNGEINYQDLTATTFPERLEQLGISWKVYQNELSIDVGLNGDEDDWLSNFTDNNLEFYKNYNVKLHKAHLAWLPKRRAALEAEIAEMQKQSVTPVITSQLKKKNEELERIKTEIAEWTQERFDKLSDYEKNIHLKAFTTNVNDPDYHKLSTLTYDDNGTQREVKVPKGDILHQFRHDVKTGKLPTVSWLAAPSNFSDHPGSPWYGAWYVSEVLDILTHNPEVWKKTIFILTYDENDGYFDHIAPFVPPNTAKAESGGASAGLDTEIEHVTNEQNQQNGPSPHQRESPIGLGFRVPLVVASPWSRGGWVNSQVFDHTSTLQFLETFLSKKTGKAVKESNISDWRRTVCGDLTSIFRPYNGEKISYPVSLNRDKTVQSIHQAKFKGLPNKFKALTADDIKTVNSKAGLSNFAKQEKGSRQSCALPYDLHVDGQLLPQSNALQLAFKTCKGTGAPFNVYGPVLNGNKTEIKAWNFAVKANDEVKYEFALDSFNEGLYNIQVHGPNGFLRTFAGDKNDPALTIDVVYQPQGDIEISFKNTGNTKHDVMITDNSYKVNNHQLSLAAGATSIQKLNLQKSHHWYDFTISLKGNTNFGRTYAGRVETGKHGFTDPLIGA